MLATTGISVRGKRKGERPLIDQTNVGYARQVSPGKSLITTPDDASALVTEECFNCGLETSLVLTNRYLLCSQGLRRRIGLLTGHSTRPGKQGDGRSEQLDRVAGP